jgi:predicted glycosyltransferase
MKLIEVSNKRVAYTCFDWGFGHVTRSIEIIRQLIAQHNEVVFFGSSNQYDFLVHYNPELKFEAWELPQLRFSANGRFVWDGLRNSFKVLKTWNIEKRTLLESHKTKPFDAVISDHRYCFRLKHVQSIFITHQVNLPEVLPSLIRGIHRICLKRFDQIWAIDESTQECAGKLSAGADEYIGIKSRFDSARPENFSNLPLLILSGPEVYAKQLLAIVRQCSKGKKIAIIAPRNFMDRQPEELWYIVGEHSYLAMDTAFMNASVIISRSGYSTIMDLRRTSKPGILLATKGQFEQLYLAEKNHSESIQCFQEEAPFLEALTHLFQRNSTGSHNG